ncbi:hypothetical protein [Acinetobacter sp. MD2(2019)]|uniref:hypothetical protein n=1 Tax=Acinetobacter sp. MD2(2019) TaxID=2605273 RepID=UPI002D1F312A|nr:hypothetical protein [Acinetobacter sp. MD2(2019)]MEB3754118.1 hypothetical protein [Acinetobacter sp. MD2(2019)]
MRHLISYLLCIVALSGCIVVTPSHAHNIQKFSLSLPLAIQVKNGYHDDDGQEHQPVRTRREQCLDDFCRDDRPDESEDLTE